MSEQPQVPTIEERIAALKAKADERQRVIKAEEVRIARRASLQESASRAVETYIGKLANMPLLPCGKTIVQTKRNMLDDCHEVALRRSWRNASGQFRDETLITFVVRVNHEGAEAWIELDGERVDETVALDMATAIVEARFNAGVSEDFADPAVPTRPANAAAPAPSDDDIPF